MIESNTVKQALSMVEAGGEGLLQITVGTHKIEKPGQFVPRADAQKAPQLSYAGSTDQFIAVALDLDAPYKSASFLGPILHWIQPGMKLSGAGETLSSGDTPFTADYIGPAPPPGSGPHRYFVLLYKQPEDFDPTKYAPPAGKSFPTTKRIRYNFDDFARGAGLGSIIAANYFNSN